MNGIEVAVPSTPERHILQVADIWLHLRSFPDDYEYVMVRKKEKAGEWLYVEVYSLTYGDSVTIRTLDAGVWTGKVWPARVA